jgi:protein-S-isoprenylcysteine O-methyltransferase Ste14
MKRMEATRIDRPASIEKGEDTMEREWILYAVAGVLVLVSWALLWIVGSPVWMWLFYLGWAILLGAMALIVLSLILLPRKGQAPRGGGITQTTAVVTTCIYAVTRHPLYLGWVLGYVALMLMAQHWLVALIAVAGIACVYLICVREERRLLARFGEEYAHYKRSVPRVNLLAGILRLLRRKKSHDRLPGNR